MVKSLFVPIRIEGLLLPEDSLVCSPLADFERLPWSDGSQDYNYDVPFLGDSIGNKPFSDRNCLLKKGLHLHFILPHFLGQAIPQESGLDRKGELPAAPNCWVIIKKRGASTVKTFFLQSDYIYDDVELYAEVAEKKREQPYSCVIPAVTSGASAGRPYAFMGKQSTAASFTYDAVNSFRAKAGEPLTVTAYGDFNFSSFYPNCKGVFGFFDAEAAYDSGISYEIYGWVHDKEDDILYQYIQKAKGDETANSLLIHGDASDKQTLRARLQNLFHVAICDPTKNEASEAIDVPTGHTVYYAKFVCDGYSLQFRNEAKDLGLKIALGNTSTEAMAALLAAKAGSPEEKSVMEEQLESVNLFSQLGGLMGDLGPKFLEARHTNGFNRISGGYKWMIAPKGAEDEKGATILVGSEILTALADLNKAQHGYDDEISELTSLKEQLYLDWAKYMRLAYPLPDEIDNELLGRVEAFLGTVAMPEVQQKISRCGEIELFKGDKGYEGSDCVNASGDESSLAFEVFTKWQRLFELLLDTRTVFSTANQNKISLTTTGATAHIRLSVNNGTLSLALTEGLTFHPSETSSGKSISFDGSIGDIETALDGLTYTPTKYVGKDALTVITADSVDGLNDGKANKQSISFVQKQPYNLICTPAHYYWQPKPPVLLISGLTSDDDDEDLLKKAGNNNKEIYTGDWDFLPNNSRAIENPPLPKDNPQRLSDQITNPFLLEWEVMLQDSALLRDEEGGIDAEALTTCVQIMEYGSDFEKLPYCTPGNTSLFSGSVILNPHARKTMIHKLIAIIKAYQADYFDLPNQQEQCEKFLSTENMEEFCRILQNQLDYPPKDMLPQCRLVLQELQTLLLDHSILAQALSGFNHACSMKGMTAQMPVLDPMGFENTQKLTHHHANLLGDKERNSPLLGFLFNPIRSGEINLNRLCLIDNFGVPAPIDIPSDITWAKTMQDDKGQPFLKPRFTQPARLHFSFLDSDRNPAMGEPKDFKELARVHNLPESSPVCGWLVPNYLDKDLLIFDKDGAALGALNKGANWEKPPYKDDAPDAVEKIPNEHLKRVVHWLAGNPDLLAAFLDSVQSAQDNMAPAQANIYQSQAILMGQPIAVLRAAVHFQLMGLPAINQSWNALVKDACNSNAYAKRVNDNWTNVQIPFRLGEHHQLDDGLIGYWMENNAAATDEQVINTLVAPESTNGSSDSRIKTFGSGNNKQQEALSVNKIKIATLLLDPRSGVHCTSGIVPTVNTRIEPDLFLPALQRLEMWFKLAAVLQPVATPNNEALLNLPNIEDKEWHWFDQFDGERSIAADETDGFLLTKNTLKEAYLTLKTKPE